MHCPSASEPRAINSIFFCFNRAGQLGASGPVPRQNEASAVLSRRPCSWTVRSFSPAFCAARYTSLLPEETECRGNLWLTFFPLVFFFSFSLLLAAQRRWVIMSSAQESAPKPSGKKTATSPAIRYPFWFGGSASSMAACVTHPLDLGMSPPVLPLRKPLRPRPRRPFANAKTFPQQSRYRLQTQSRSLPTSQASTATRTLPAISETNVNIHGRRSDCKRDRAMPPRT